MEQTEFERKPGVDFFDAEQGIACWNRCITCEGNVHVAFAKIHFFVKHDDFYAVERLREFLKALFCTHEVYEEPANAGSACTSNEITFTVVKPEISLQQDAEFWLTKCTVLNTYRAYFTATSGLTKIRILCGIYSYETQEEMNRGIEADILNGDGYLYTEHLAINDIVYANTGAKDEVPAYPVDRVRGYSAKCSSQRWYAYNLTYTKLSEDLMEGVKPY